MAKQKNNLGKAIEQAVNLSHLPGDVLEKATVVDDSPEQTPFRGAEDLKQQFFGPTLWNKQRLWELGDSALYQGAYGLPAAGIGALVGGPAGMFAGLGTGKLLGQLHLFSKEKDRLDTALKYFNKGEKKLLEDITSSGNKWGITAAILAGLGAGGTSYLAGQDQFGKVLTPVLAGGAAASLAGLGGLLLGQHLAKQRALKSKRFKDIIKRYDKFE